MATLIRPIQLHAGSSADLDGVMRVMEAAFGSTYGEAWTRSQCAGILPMTGVALMLARDDDCRDTIGFSLFRTVADDAELLLLAVHPDRHRQGIGARLLDAFIDRARTQGARQVHLEVRDGNPAVAMYTAHGFAPIGRRTRYYRGPGGERFDAITLARKT
ncbi:GNAT family N-acetyltransferase [Sphingomonas lutea]|uniref:GNAT family N-acetyltransferase n=1 Tax=Sphingomonas lutea TaxID=1045317 RepID=A0A7G9SGW2_9SPHN|nr:GNAT family N-acetyltransferase [Sphingomonas lutea]QNN67087.1 GNAT family N-acetyltransferase [Sphingomonas lutea]